MWPKLLGYERVGIVDALTVRHTRPIGTMRDAELFERLLHESDETLSCFDCRQVHVTFGALGPDLSPLDITPERLLVELVKGFQYLSERDPRVLSWWSTFTDSISVARTTQLRARPVHDRPSSA